MTTNLEPSDLKPENKNPSSSSPTPAAMIRAATDATEEEAEEIVSSLRSHMQIKSWSGLIKTMAANGDLTAKLADVRAANALFADLGNVGSSGRYIDWCGKCSDDAKRQATTANGGLTRCPTCHPLRHQAVNPGRGAAYSNPLNDDDFDDWNTPPGHAPKPQLTEGHPR